MIRKSSYYGTLILKQLLFTYTYTYTHKCLKHFILSLKIIELLSTDIKYSNINTIENNNKYEKY